ncbi:MAG: energy-coupling factor transporter ATPase [candidate division Zixibacteria bacterium]
MIEIKNIAVQYPRGDLGPAISSFDLHLSEGEYLSVLGPNGSGKSTLIKAICGMIKLSNGEIKINDEIVRPGRFGDDLFGVVAAVFQEPGGQFLMPDVKSEIMTVLQNLGLPLKRQKEVFDLIVSRFSLERLLDLKPHNLSGGQTQIVNLACAVVVSPKILLLDEPTTFLDPGYRETILDIVDSLKRDGMAIIHITQYTDEALRADKVLIMDSGSIAAFGDPREILADDELLAKYRLTTPSRIVCHQTPGIDYIDKGAVGFYRVNIEDRETSADNIPERIAESERLLNAEDLEFSYPDSDFKLEIIGLGLYSGSVTGIVGPAGSGKSTLAMLLAGILKPKSGKIFIDGTAISDYSQKDLRTKIGISWQMPENVLIGPTVADDLNSIKENLDLKDIDIYSILEQVGLAGFETRIVDSLSGGEKRKVSLAGTLISDPDVVILDEPAAFLDPFSQIELARIIEGLANAGKAVMVIGHDLPFLAEIADRMVGMIAGKKVFDISACGFFNSPEYLEIIDLPVNPLINLRKHLVSRGIILPKPSLNPRYLAAEIDRQSSGEGKSLDN